MYVQCADEPPLRVSDGQGRDAVRFHDVHSFGGEGSRPNGLAVRSHYGSHGRVMHVDLLIKSAPQVAVGKHAENTVIQIHDDRHAQSLT